MQKQIFVRSYTKSDGTVVKAHYRNIDGTIHYDDSFDGNIDDIVFDDYEMHGPMPQKKGNVPPETSEENNKSESKGGFDIGEILSNVLEIAIIGANYAQLFYKAMQQNNSDAAKFMLQKVDNSIDNIQSVQKRSEELSNSYLKSLVNTKDNTEYQNLLKSFARQKNITEKISNKIARIKYARENNNYPVVIDELQNFESDFDEVMQKTRETRPILSEKYVDNLYKKYKFRTTTGRSPVLDKKFVNAGMFLYSYAKKGSNARELWKGASTDFKRSKKYTNKNGNLIYSVDDLPTKNLQDIVRKKLKEQLNVEDSLGVVFKSNSSLSNALSESDELKKFFYNNYFRLIKGDVINSSKYFGSNFELSKSLGNADILYAYLDENKNFRLIIFDTYDFNVNDPDYKVRIARNTQEYRIIRNYYILVLVYVPLYKWIKWLT